MGGNDRVAGHVGTLFILARYAIQVKRAARPFMADNDFRSCESDPFAVKLHVSPLYLLVQACCDRMSRVALTGDQVHKRCELLAFGHFSVEQGM